MTKINLNQTQTYPNSMHPVLVNRFDKAYNNTDNSLLSIRGNHFVFINSMSLEGDGCDLCTEAEEKLRTLGKQLDCAKGVGTCHNIKRIGEYSQPIIMQVYINNTVVLGCRLIGKLVNRVIFNVAFSDISKI